MEFLPAFPVKDQALYGLYELRWQGFVLYPASWYFKITNNMILNLTEQRNLPGGVFYMEYQ